MDKVSLGYDRIYHEIIYHEILLKMCFLCFLYIYVFSFCNFFPPEFLIHKGNSGSSPAAREREGPWPNCSALWARNATFSTAPSCSRRACSAPGCRCHPAPDRLRRSIVPQGLSLPHVPPPSPPSAALPDLHPYSILVLTLCYKDIDSFDYHIWNVAIAISDGVSLLCHSPIFSI